VQTLVDNYYRIPSFSTTTMRRLRLGFAFLVVTVLLLVVTQDGVSAATSRSSTDRIRGEHGKLSLLIAVPLTKK